MKLTADYVARGTSALSLWVGSWFLWPILELAMKCLIQWGMLRTLQALNIVQRARSICLPPLLSVHAAASVRTKARKRKH